MWSKQRILMLIAFLLSGVAVSAVVINAPTKRPSAYDRPPPEPEQTDPQRSASDSASDDRSGSRQAESGDPSEADATADRTTNDDTGDTAAQSPSASDENDGSSVEQRLEYLILEKYEDVDRELDDDDFEYIIGIANNTNRSYLNRMFALMNLMGRASPMTSKMDESRVVRVRSALHRAMTDDNWYLRHTGIAAFGRNNGLELDAEAISLIRGLRNDSVDRVAYMANSVVLPGDRERGNEDGPGAADRED